MADPEEERMGILPESLSMVVKAIGFSATLSLVHFYAGTRIYVPRQDNLGDEHPLVNLLGRPLAEKLANAIGGEYLEVPMARAFREEERKKIIIERMVAGESRARIAQSLGVSVRWVQAVMDRARGKTP